MSEVELGEYLRSNGIMRENLDNWRKVCEEANEAQAERARVQMSELVLRIFEIPYPVNLPLARIGREIHHIERGLVQ